MAVHSHVAGSPSLKGSGFSPPLVFKEALSSSPSLAQLAGNTTPVCDCLSHPFGARNPGNFNCLSVDLVGAILLFLHTTTHALIASHCISPQIMRKVHVLCLPSHKHPPLPSKKGRGRQHSRVLSSCSDVHRHYDGSQVISGSHSWPSQAVALLSPGQGHWQSPLQPHQADQCLPRPCSCTFLQRSKARLYVCTFKNSLPNYQGHLRGVSFGCAQCRVRVTHERASFSMALRFWQSRQGRASC